MENTKVLHALDEFAKVKPKDIPSELEEYIRFVASCGDHVYQWSLVKCLFRQKLVNVISEFYESCPMMDVPVSPNVDAFNYEQLKSRLLQRYDKFIGAPFTIQRIAELLTTPRKQYNRVDKFMRAIEKNIWVVSTREPGRRELVTQDAILNVNGMVANDAKLQTCPQERLKRQSELFDEDEDEDEGEDEPVVTLNAEIPVPQPEIVEESSTSTVTRAEDSSPEPTEASSMSSPDPLEFSKTPEQDIEPTSIEEPADETIEQPEPIANVSLSEQPAENAEVEVHQDDEEEEDDEDTTEKSISDVAVTELSEPDVSDDLAAPAVVEDPVEPEVIESENKSDLKRKFDESEEEKEVPHKKLGIEEKVTEEAQEVEAPQVAAEGLKEEEVKGSEVIAEATEAEANEDAGDEETREDASVSVEVVEEKVVEDTNKEPEIVEREVKTSLVEIAQVEELAEKEMESVESEEKVEMVVEEPEQAMEVDETSVQSPMECAVAEPMEESDVGQS